MTSNHKKPLSKVEIYILIILKTKTIPNLKNDLKVQSLKGKFWKVKYAKTAKTAQKCLLDEALHQKKI